MKDRNEEEYDMPDVLICEHCGREFWWHDDYQVTNHREHVSTCVRDTEFVKKWKELRGIK